MQSSSSSSSDNGDFIIQMNQVLLRITIFSRWVTIYFDFFEQLNNCHNSFLSKIWFNLSDKLDYYCYIQLKIMLQCVIILILHRTNNLQFCWHIFYWLVFMQSSNVFYALLDVQNPRSKSMVLNIQRQIKRLSYILLLYYLCASTCRWKIILYSGDNTRLYECNV